MKILDTETGIVVEVPERYTCANHGDGGEFMWTEGNYSCDCNRALIHFRAQDLAAPNYLPCGDTRFRLLDVPWEKKDD